MLYYSCIGKYRGGYALEPFPDPGRSIDICMGPILPGCLWGPGDEGNLYKT